MSNSEQLSRWSKELSVFEQKEERIILDTCGMSIGEWLKENKELVHRSSEMMKDVESGEIANPDENRMVGHYWLRTPGIAPAELGSEINKSIEKIKSFAAHVLEGQIVATNGEPFKAVLVIGIGGSALGPQLLMDALGEEGGLPVFFLDNTDPEGIARVFNSLPSVSHTLALVVSKSGGTRETFNGEHLFIKALTKAGGAPEKQVVAITCQGSALSDRASERYLEQFPLWDWVGGRTSVTGAVGLLPAALAGIDISRFLAGAHDMDEATRGVTDSIAMRLAAAWYKSGSGKGEKNMVVLPYRDRLLLFSRYLQQLVMESLGKSEDLDGHKVYQGMSVFGNKGSTDQHAFVQQLRDGRNDFFVTFIDVLVDEYDSKASWCIDTEIEEGVTAGDYLAGFFQGTRQALTASNRDQIALTLSELNPYTLGALISLFERAVGLYAGMINVNAYHQPGVEAGKKAAQGIVDYHLSLIKLLSKEKTLSMDALFEALGIAEDWKAQEQVVRIIWRLDANKRIKVEGEGLVPEKVSLA